MKKLALGLLALFLALSPARGQAIGPPNSVFCNKTATFTGTGAAAIVIAAVPGQTINFCGWHITNSAASGTFAITTGTGAGCGTGTVNVTPTLSVTSTAPSSDHIDWAYSSSVVGGQYCVNATLTTVTGVLFFSQLP